MADASDRLFGFTMAFETTPRIPAVESAAFDEPPREGHSRCVRMRRALRVPDQGLALITHAASSSTYRRLKSPLSEVDRAEAGGFRSSPIVMRAWERTLGCAAILRATAILFQCPASFRPTEDNLDRMRAFFATVQRPSGVRMLWEPRGPWPADVVATLCHELDLVHVVDVRTHLTPGADLLRLHGYRRAAALRCELDIAAC